MNYTKDRANLFIAENKPKVNQLFRPRFHAAPPLGWMNDPNGVIYFQNKYHVFYQFFPYDAKWGPMHWGHFESDDLISFTDLPVALAPNGTSDGCFSGGAIIGPKGELTLMYTEHYELEGKLEQQKMAVSFDGVEFRKQDLPFLTKDHLPPNAQKSDFRDPRPIYLDGVYYVLVGSKTLDNVGQFLVYKSGDLKTFTYHFTIGPDIRFGEMAECPDVFTLDGVDVLIMSGIKVAPRGKEFVKANSSIAFLGKIDFVNKTYHFDNYHEIDLGHDFYAPQTLVSPTKERVMIAWMNMWDKEYFTTNNNHGWVGQLTLPRVLSVKDNRLVQTPSKNITKYYSKQKPLINNQVISKWSHLSLTLDLQIDHDIIFANPHNGVDFFTLFCKSGYLGVDTSTTNNYLQGPKVSLRQYKKVKVEVFFDSSSIELFIDNGSETITTTLFMETEGYFLSFAEKFVTGHYHDLVKEGK